MLISPCKPCLEKLIGVGAHLKLPTVCRRVTAHKTHNTRICQLRAGAALGRWRRRRCDFSGPLRAPSHIVSAHAASLANTGTRHSSNWGRTCPRHITWCRDRRRTHVRCVVCSARRALVTWVSEWASAMHLFSSVDAEGSRRKSISRRPPPPPREIRYVATPPWEGFIIAE